MGQNNSAAIQYTKDQMATYMPYLTAEYIEHLISQFEKDGIMPMSGDASSVIMAY